MNNTTVPFRLSHGLILEPEGLLLPWHSETKALSHIGSPQIQETSGVTFLTWQGSSVLGDIESDVMFRSDSKKVFWLEIPNKKDFGSATEAFEFVHPLLTTRLGTAHSSVVDEGYPWVRWQYGAVRISLRVAERFTEYLSFMVSNGL